MSEAYLTTWSYGGEGPSTRDHFHETALHEARIATDQRETEPGGAAHTGMARDGLRARLRLAFAGPAATDACNCPA